ncbi:hypothetical protein BGX23_000583, partial [Mortierella sp. AD031]
MSTTPTCPPPPNAALLQRGVPIHAAGRAQRRTMAPTAVAPPYDRPMPPVSKIQENQVSATSHPTNPAIALGPLSNLSVSRCLRGNSRQHHPRSSKILPGLAQLVPAPGRGASASPHPAEAHGTPSCNDPGIPGQRSHLEPRAGAGGGGTEGRINATVEKLQIQED